jgi:aminoglycoside phosphotransferase (APT) family kinase protein
MNIAPPAPTAAALEQSVACFVARWQGVPADRVALELRPLSQGLEAAGVYDVRARHEDLTGRSKQVGFVVKRLGEGAARELSIHAAAGQAGIAPRLLGIEPLGDTAWLACLERVRAWRAWPWQDPALAALVFEKLAHLHTAVEPPPAAQWDYEAFLQASARQTLAVFDQVAWKPELAPLRSRRRALERLVGEVPRLRATLMAGGTALLHGDVHTGNVVLRMRKQGPEAVLLDWGRSRIGSPLEDVSSWLASLGFWEPAVMRGHDTLLRHYLVTRGGPATLDRQLRDRYWLAGASNALAGALRYHLAVAGHDGRPDRSRSLRAAADWLRVIRRADALWR